MTTTIPAINEEKLGQFMQKVLYDFGGAASAILTYIGDKLGLYKAMYDLENQYHHKNLQTLLEHQSVI